MPMVLLSSLTILISSFLAFIFPYQALQLSTFSLYILGLITVLAYLDYDFKNKIITTKFSPKDVIFYLMIVFVLVPGLLWYLAYFFISDRSLRLGLFLSSICPPALIIPLFLKNNRALILKAHQSILLFTAVFPILMLLMLQAYSFNEFQVSIKNLFIDIFSVTALPIIILYLLKKFTNTSFNLVSLKIRQMLSLLSIALLTFCYFGVAYTKSNVATISTVDLLVLLLLVVLQDFGVYYFMRELLKYFEKPKDLLLTLLSSLRNVAIAGYILIFYMPKAALVPAMIMVVHAAYFIFLEYNIKINEE